MYFWTRLYRIRLMAALLIALPAWLFIFWYGWRALAAFDRYRRAAGDNNKLTTELFQIFLHDQLMRDLGRFTLRALPAKSAYQHLRLQIRSYDAERLLSGAGAESGRPFVKAELHLGNEVIPAEVRLRGQQPWHHLGPKKSLKVTLERGHLYQGMRTFNLQVDPDPLLIGEQLIMDLAREEGLLVPCSTFARLQVNGADLGLFRLLGQPDESVLRLNRRFPGSIYSGNLPRSARSNLWRETGVWKKVAWMNEAEKENRQDLEWLLKNIASASVREFADYARRYIDLRAFATMEALDVIFGVEEHNHRQNQKLYFDPYRGHWEPVVWAMRGFRHRPQLNLCETPLGLRLKMLPEYLTLRNRIILNLLDGPAGLPRLRERSMRLFRELAPELASDLNWSAYKLLPRVDNFWRRMLRPMNFEKLAMVFEAEMAGLKERQDFIRNQLEENPWGIWLERDQGRKRLVVVVDGPGGVELTGWKVSWPESCRPGEWRIEKDGKPLIASRSDYASVEEGLLLYPAVKFVAAPDLGKDQVRTQSAPATYHFELIASCLPERIHAEGTNLVTGSRVVTRKLDRLPQIEGQALGVDDVPGLVSGEISPHPQTFLQAPAEEVTLGPGRVEISETRVFGAHQTVLIEPGTEIVLNKGASLIFLGRVKFAGQYQKPISISAGANSGMVLQGPHTAGSEFSYVFIKGGEGSPRCEQIHCPAVLNIHHTGDISLQNCTFGESRGVELLHVVYVENLFLADDIFYDAGGDALDLEFVSGRLSRVQVAGAADECLDAMGSQLEIADCVFSACSGAGLSVGEESRLRVRDTLVARSQIGALVKNASRLEISSSLLFRNRTGVEVYRKEVRFPGPSEVLSDVLHVLKASRALRRGDRRRQSLDQGVISRTPPPPEQLRRLREEVLGLSGWEELESFLDNLEGRRQ